MSFSFKPNELQARVQSHVMQTTLMVILMVMMSVGLSAWLFWRTLYLPELKNHASFLANELTLVNDSRTAFAQSPKVNDWLLQHTHLKIVDAQAQFPEIRRRVIADFFTDVLKNEVERELGRKVVIYFKFKPSPTLWIQDSRYPDILLQEPVVHYAHYSPFVFFLFLVGLPVMTLIIILLLVRTLNRPLKQLEKVAAQYLRLGSVATLPTNVGPREIRQVNSAFNGLFWSLEQAQKERSIMLAGISHDLRTPLTRMRLTAEMLDNEIFKEGLIYDIEDMDAILEQFISFMKDGSDEPIKDTHLDAICHEIMVQFNEVQFIYESNVPQSVRLRPLSIKRLLVNLVNNAKRYGQEPIHLITKVLPTQEEPLLLLCVKDEGAGVAEDQLQRIIQPFERGETARTTQGSGLGLAIVSRIAKLHQGWVDIINHPEGGLQVCVYIPLKL